MTEKKYHHGNLKTEAIKEAVELSKQSHLLGWSLRQLAKHMGVSHVALYNHFDAKQDLLYEVAIYGFNELITLSQQEHSLKKLGECYIQFAHKNSVVFEAMFHPELPPANNPKLAQTASAYMNLVKKTIQEDSSISSDYEKVFLRSWAAVHGYAHLISKGILQKTDISEQTLSTSVFLDSLWDSRG